ncbi:hypothetical protein EDEG_03995 [Edhazardia aedis USNM 41457]|uniref:Uncharacterized protein n=1 Tax=Edhazardia aedis (strain USNM 41457) TaxID=1003232 RepID=J9D0F8_EDHAE|nr:hypothetical protein EDEG_03995 [Edhazardia aedis USNM 41457]|eukprot:EJW01376.1 hypothetical protein EDEG_03995 [Edhazardia aedis USNM 41457]
MIRGTWTYIRKNCIFIKKIIIIHNNFIKIICFLFLAKYIFVSIMLLKNYYTVQCVLKTNIAIKIVTFFSARKILINHYSHHKLKNRLYHKISYILNYISL